MPYSDVNLPFPSVEKLYNLSQEYYVYSCVVLKAANNRDPSVKEKSILWESVLETRSQIAKSVVWLRFYTDLIHAGEMEKASTFFWSLNDYEDYVVTFSMATRILIKYNVRLDMDEWGVFL